MTHDIEDPNIPIRDRIYNKDANGGLSFEEYCEQTEALGRMLHEESVERRRLEAIEKERAALDTVVFNLSKGFDTTSPCTVADFPSMLDRNAQILNAAFEYYLEKAVESKIPDKKIQLAARMQSQLIRTMDVRRRFENFHQSKTK